MTIALRILPPAPVAHCMPWRLRNPHEGQWLGARCCYCDREIAAPVSAKGRHVACIYCGLDRGEILAIDVPLYDNGVQ